MTAPTEREQRLIVALDEAVGGALRRYGGQPAHLGIRAALVDGLQVLAREFGPRVDGNPGAEPVPVHELPREPGAVVLVTAACGTELDPPCPAIRDNGPGDSAPWDTGAAIIPAEGRRFLDDSDITGWVAARVVRDDDRGPRAALEEILKVAEDKDIPDDEARDLMASDAREALARLGGAT